AWHEPGVTLELMFHEPSWQELPDDLKMMVRACASELDNWMLSTWSSKNAEYLQKIKSEGKVIVRELPAEILKSLKTYSDEVIAELVASTAMAKKIYSSYSSFQKRLEEYIDMAEMPFVRAFKL
ncbi:MAG: hypothetical protein KDD53_11535, partial [Bdellovibrionales bacterium]|nr:hypothetical protein [Bdellovibrionales bacterium]